MGNTGLRGEYVIDRESVEAGEVKTCRVSVDDQALPDDRSGYQSVKASYEIKPDRFARAIR